MLEHDLDLHVLHQRLVVRIVELFFAQQNRAVHQLELIQRLRHHRFVFFLVVGRHQDASAAVGDDHVGLAHLQVLSQETIIERAQCEPRHVHPHAHGLLEIAALDARRVRFFERDGLDHRARLSIRGDEHVRQLFDGRQSVIGVRARQRGEDLARLQNGDARDDGVGRGHGGNDVSGHRLHIELARQIDAEDERTQIGSGGDEAKVRLVVLVPHKERRFLFARHYNGSDRNANRQGVGRYLHGVACRRVASAR